MKLILKGFGVDLKIDKQDAKVHLDEVAIEYAPEELQNYQQAILSLTDKFMPILDKVVDEAIVDSKASRARMDALHAAVEKS